MKKEQILLIMLVSLNISGGSAQLDPNRIHEYKENIHKRVYRNWFLKRGIYTTGALVTVFAVYNFYFKPPEFSVDQVAKILNLQLENQVKEAKISKSFLQKIVGVGSDIARSFFTGFSVVAQNVALTIGAESLSRKSEGLRIFPGNIIWFIEHQTHLEELLQDYAGYAACLKQSALCSSSEVERAYESITTQLPEIVTAVETILAYMEYVHPKLGTLAQKEADTVRQYLTHVTDEFLAAVSEDEPDYSCLASSVQQFITEAKSLSHRFKRLQSQPIV